MLTITLHSNIKFRYQRTNEEPVLTRSCLSIVILVLLVTMLIENVVQHISFRICQQIFNMDSLNSYHCSSISNCTTHFTLLLYTVWISENNCLWKSLRLYTVMKFNLKLKRFIYFFVHPLWFGKSPYSWLAHDTLFSFHIHTGKPMYNPM